MSKDKDSKKRHSLSESAQNLITQLKKDGVSYHMALSELDIIIESSPHISEYYHHKAVIHYILGYTAYWRTTKPCFADAFENYTKSLENFVKAIELNPECHDYKYHKGELLYNAAEMELQIEKENPGYYFSFVHNGYYYKPTLQAVCGKLLITPSNETGLCDHDHIPVIGLDSQPLFSA